MEKKKLDIPVDIERLGESKMTGRVRQLEKKKMGYTSRYRETVRAIDNES